MKCIIFLHSTTGNTRLVARFAAEQLKEAGHECSIHDITRHRDPPPLDDVDLIGIACSTMYWRPTQAMERFVARLPAASPHPKPAFQIATASGDPGSHFALVAEQLQYKDWITLHAWFVPMVNNWPPHRALAEKVPLASTIATSVEAKAPGRYHNLSLLWPDLGEPRPRHRDGLVDFLRDITRRAEAGDLSGARPPDKLFKGNRLFAAIGRLMTVEQMRQTTDIRIDSNRCGRCGTCVKLCPVDCLTRDGEDDVLRVGTTCTGCWTCFNHCPDQAISGWASPAGAGQFPGPSVEARELFRTK